MQKKSLREVFDNHKGRMIDKWLHYFDVYDYHFSPFRNKPVRVLEIGIFQGGSLQMWKEYFGSLAQIVGIDINPQCKQFEEENIHIYIGDQADKVFLRQLVAAEEAFDIIIDDGGHAMNQLRISFDALFPALKPGGIYLAEDLHTCYMPEYGGGYQNPANFIEYGKRMLDYVNAGWIKGDGFVCPEHLKNLASIHAYDSILVMQKSAAGEKVVHQRKVVGVPSFPMSDAYWRSVGMHNWVGSEYSIGSEQVGSFDSKISAREDSKSGGTELEEAHAGAAEEVPDQQYWRWIDRRMLTTHERLWMREVMHTWQETAITFHFTLLLLPGFEHHLQENIATLQQQVNCNWRMTVVAFDPRPEWLVLPDQVSWREVSDEEDSLDVLNELAGASEWEWVTLWNAGDRIEPDALFHLARKIRQNPQWQMVYTDEDVLDDDLRRMKPHFKPDFNLDLLRSCPYIGGLTFFRASMFSALGGYAHEAEGAEYYDLTFRILERCGEDVIGHYPALFYHARKGSGHSYASAEEIWENYRNTVQRHLDRVACGAKALPGFETNFMQIEYPLLHRPRVSIIIPTKDRPDLLKRCMQSLLARTSYDNFEVLLVDNNTSNLEALEYLEELSIDQRIRVLQYAEPFNFSAENNLAAQMATGEYLVLLNNDTEIVDGQWLEKLLRHATRPEVGIVGPLLIFDHGAVQHAGVVLGLGYRPAEHPFIDLPPDAPGYMGRLRVTQNYSAVTGACLMVRKSLFEQVGGLDEVGFAVNYNDIDLCLKIGALKHKVVWTPDTRLIHIGSQTQRDNTIQPQDKLRSEARKNEEVAMYDKWLPMIVREPAWNPQLSRAERVAMFEPDPMLTSESDWVPRQRILGHPLNNSGRGLYRIIQPAEALMDAGVAMSWATTRIYGQYEIAKLRPDVVVMQEQTKGHQVEAIKRYRKYADPLIVFELDDLVTALNKRNFPGLTAEIFDPEKKSADLAEALSLSDRFIVSTPYLKEAYSQLCSDIRVVPNFLSRNIWGRVNAVRRGGEKPRVGWAGGGSHIGDLEMLVDVVRVLANEVDWVFFGMCPDAIKPFVKEFHLPVPIEAYPSYLATMDLDLALAPLEVHDFNRGKSALRLLEYGIMGYPVICTDLDPYQGDYPVTRVSNDVDDWVSAIRKAVSDRDDLARKGDLLRQFVLGNYMLEDNLDMWLKAWSP